MQKKIVAAICAAALALALPVAAMAASEAVDSNGTVEITESIKSSNSKVKLAKVTFTGVNSSVKDIKVEGASSTTAPSSGAIIPGSAGSFTVQAQDKDWKLVDGLGPKAVMAATVDFDASIETSWGPEVPTGNLYIGASFDSKFGRTVYMQPKALDLGQSNAGIASLDGNDITMTGLGTGTLNVWIQTNPLPLNAPSADPSAVAEKAKDGSTSPQTGELL